MYRSRSQLPATSGFSRLPLKKRKYVADSDGPEPAAKVSKQPSNYDQKSSQSLIKERPMHHKEKKMQRHTLQEYN